MIKFLNLVLALFFCLAIVFSSVIFAQPNSSAKARLSSDSLETRDSQSAIESNVLNEKGVAQIKNRKFAAAEISFRSSLASNPDNITAVFNLASTYLINKKEAAAIELLKAYLPKAPTDCGLIIRLGDAYFGIKQVDQALTMYEQAFKIDPTYPQLLSKLSTTYLLNNKTAEAEKYLILYVEQNPKDAKANANLASIYLANGKVAEAIAAAKKTLQINASKEVYVTLATAYEINKEYKNALIAFERARDLGDTRPEISRKIAGLKKVAL